jgi:hypothetical protein
LLVFSPTRSIRRILFASVGVITNWNYKMII